MRRRAHIDSARDGHFFSYHRPQRRFDDFAGIYLMPRCIPARFYTLLSFHIYSNDNVRGRRKQRREVIYGMPSRSFTAASATEEGSRKYVATKRLPFAMMR